LDKFQIWTIFEFEQIWKIHIQTNFKYEEFSNLYNFQKQLKKQKPKVPVNPQKTTVKPSRNLYQKTVTVVKRYMGRPIVLIAAGGMDYVPRRAGYRNFLVGL
jgi:hypothetical protein